MGKELPNLRWGILGTGWISTNFVQDLLIARPDARAHHQVVALGSSSIAKAEAFVSTVWKGSSASEPQLYDNYQAVYDDPQVQIVYIGTPHALHKQNCLDAIAAGKHVLCEKPLTINAKEAAEVIDAARAKGIFMMEAMWTRFLPIMKSLHDQLHVQQSIGTIQRIFIDFSLQMKLDSLPPTSRLKDPSLGAGALLDIGIYPLTIASLVLGGGKVGDEHPQAEMVSCLNVVNGIDIADVVVLKYPSNPAVATNNNSTRQSCGWSTAICTANMQHAGSWNFATIEGSKGSISIAGLAPSIPSELMVTLHAQDDNKQHDNSAPDDKVEKVLKFEHPGLGFHFEADAVAIDIAAGRTENETMPLAETVRLLKLMDRIRKQGGVVYPQDQ